MKCSKEPKKQNKHIFYFSLYGVLNVRSGWVGSAIKDKVLKKKIKGFPDIKVGSDIFSWLLKKLLAKSYDYYCPD